MSWLHRIERGEVASRAPRPRHTRQAVNEIAGIEALLLAASVEHALTKLDYRQANVIWRRHLEEQDWQTIRVEMGYPKVYEAKRAYRQAMMKLANLLTGECSTNPA